MRPALSWSSTLPSYFGDPGAPVVDRPVSRWSYRTTRRPCEAIAEQSSTSHQSIDAAAPDIRTIVGSVGSPNSWMHSSTSPTVTSRGSSAPPVMEQS